MFNVQWCPILLHAVGLQAFNTCRDVDITYPD